MFSRLRFLLLPVLALCLAAAPGCRRDTDSDEQGPGSGERHGNRSNVRFGMPTDARASTRDRDDYLIERPQYVLSYNDHKRTPNWVSWQLRKSDIGHAQRGPFEPDPLLPAGFARVTSHVYDGSGFDRGHMCPAQDRSATQEDMDATFFLTNIVPQSPNCNQRAWERLESYCRNLTRDGHELYICAGPHGKGGEGRNGFRELVGRDRTEVTVPHEVWKVILVLPHHDAEPRHNTRSIAVIMPNDQSVEYDWARFRVSVARVEKLTGFTFFRDLPPDVARAIKGRVDDVEVRGGQGKGD